MTWERSVVHVVVVSHCLSLPRSDKMCKNEWGGGGGGRVESSVCTTFATNSVTGKFAFNFYQTRK